MFYILFQVLESFKIMDYSLLVGIHNLDLAFKEKEVSVFCNCNEILLFFIEPDGKINMK